MKSGCFHILLVLTANLAPCVTHAQSTKPNIVYFLVDNLGYGELGTYGGGILRGAETKSIDAFAEQGYKLLNFAPETQCTPSRSALMTGRYSIRSGTHTVALAGDPGGIVSWEKTMGDILSDEEYATSIVGKWHIGASEGRWPTDHGFDEWYGIGHSYDEAFWAEDPWYDPDRDPVAHVLESKKGGAVRELEQLTVDVKLNLDREFLDRSRSFMEREKRGHSTFLIG